MDTQDHHHSKNDSSGPKIDKRGAKELGSDCGGGETLTESGDGSFPGVMEFTDSGVNPGSQGEEECTGELNKDMGKLITTDLNGSKLLRVDTTDDTFDSTNDPTWSSQICTSETIDGVRDQSGTAELLDDTGVEKSSVKSRGVIGEQFDSFPVKFDTPTDGLNKKKQPDVNQGTEKKEASEHESEDGEGRSSCGLEISPDASKFEAQDIQSHGISQGLNLHLTDSEPSQKAHSENATLDLTDIESGVSGDEIMRATNLIEGENTDDNELNRSLKSFSAKRETLQEHGDSSFESGDDQTDRINQNQHCRSPTIELLETARCESSKVGGGVMLLTKTEAAHESVGQMQKPTSDMVPNEEIDVRRKAEQASSRGDRRKDKNSQESPEGCGSGNVVAVSVGFASKDFEVNPEVSNIEKVVPMPVDDELLNETTSAVEPSHTKEAVKSTSDRSSEPSRDEVGDMLECQYDGASVVDISLASNSQADSLEGQWGSVSVISTQSDSTADAGGLLVADSQPSERSKAYTQLPKHATDRSDIFDPPSFMTLVEPGNGVSKNVAPSEIQTLHNTQQTKPEDPRAGWFPSLSNVTNESQGRKKNQEIIEKVSNWSTGKQHGPFKNLLAEAKPPSLKQVPIGTQRVETASNSNDATVPAVNTILHKEPPNDQIISKQTENGWDSPARYPSEIKKEKRKGKPYWMPFVCCSSVHRDF